MRPVESSCPGGSEFCVIKGGRRCFRISNGRPKFTLFKNNKKPICCVKIKCKSRNFQNWACPHKSLLPKDYGKKWFTKASSLLNYFEQPKHGQKMLYPQSPIHIDFLNPEGVRIPWVLAPKIFGDGAIYEKFRFLMISLSVSPPPQKKKEEKKGSGLCTDLPHSQFRPSYPKVFRVTQKVNLVSSACPPSPSLQPIRKVVHDFRCFRFFWTE